MTLGPEEQGRAHFYALLSRLFYAAPDAGLLAALVGAAPLEADDEALAGCWRELAAAAGKADAEAVREEFETAFVGAGRAPVTLYASAYSIRTNEAPLAGLREDLARLGFARRSDAGEPEDHIAALADVMRHLIMEGRLEDQQRFFARWMQPTFERLCNAIELSEHTSFYKVVARMAKAFLVLEQSAFEML